MICVRNNPGICLKWKILIYISSSIIILKQSFRGNCPNQTWVDIPDHSIFDAPLLFLTASELFFDNQGAWFRGLLRYTDRKVWPISWENKEGPIRLLYDVKWENSDEKRSEKVYSLSGSLTSTPKRDTHFETCIVTRRLESKPAREDLSSPVQVEKEITTKVNRESHGIQKVLQ
jgi:hypothetical protein